jgi:hypothetical protein
MKGFDNDLLRTIWHGDLAFLRLRHADRRFDELGAERMPLVDDLARLVGCRTAWLDVIAKQERSES